jgi:hypothetical protein
MKLKREKIPEYHRWPIDSTRFLLPVIAVRGFSLNRCEIYIAFWKYRARFSVQSNSNNGASKNMKTGIKIDGTISLNGKVVDHVRGPRCSRAAAGSRPNHPRADEMHPLTRLPKGYRWMYDRETIRQGCKYVKFDSPQWHNVTKLGGEYSVFGHHPMACPIDSEQ